MKNAHNIDDIIHIFDKTFFERFNTKLIKGDDEPIYLPANEQCDYHQIVFAHGFYASALHEISHWCIAGAKRRLLEDFGYWYEPDGRDAQQQKQFEQVEIKPQAVEWALCVATGKSFNVSADNLDGAAPDIKGFKNAVYQQVELYLHHGFPSRAMTLIEQLASFYGTQLPLTSDDFLRVSPL